MTSQLKGISMGIQVRTSTNQDYPEAFEVYDHDLDQLVASCLTQVDAVWLYYNLTRVR